MERPDSGEKSTSFAGLLLRRLPQRDFCNALRHSAEVWRDVLDVPVCLAAHPGGHASCQGAWALPPRRFGPTGSWASSDGPEPWSPRRTLQQWERELGDQWRRLRGEPITIAFPADSSLGGGVVLVPESDERPPQQLWLDWATCSARFLEQVRLGEPAARNATAPFSENGKNGEPRQTPNAERLSALAEFAAGAGHEINNPLATISGRVQLLLQGETDADRRQALATIGGQALRIRDMIGDLMLFARPPRPQTEPLNLAEVVRATVESLRETADAEGCTLHVDGEDPVPVCADRTQLQVVVGNLVHNSLEALETGGPVTVTVRRVVESGTDWGLLQIEDHGPGLSETDRRHLFDPFYSGRQAGRGLGFGLSKCWRIVTNHGGRMDVDSAPGGPTRFRVYWPADPGVSRR